MILSNILFFKEHLKRDVCAEYFEDIETCIEGVEKWTKPMIRGGLNSSDFGKTFCYHYGICRDQEVSTDTYPGQN